LIQSFTATTRPEDGPARLKALRGEIAQASLDGFLVPRSDAHQGEWVRARDERLAWLTGFTGSAGFCVALAGVAGVFIDGRYRIQIKNQIDLTAFTPVNWPEASLSDWLKLNLPAGGRIGFDPWLHVKGQIDGLRTDLNGSGILIVETENLVDRVWPQQPGITGGPIVDHPIAFAGETSRSKRGRLAASLAQSGQSAQILSLPDSIAWLLNIRGSDIACTPSVLAFAILYETGAVDLFVDESRLEPALLARFGDEIRVRAEAEFGPALDALMAPVRLDTASAPVWISNRLDAANIATAAAPDLCSLPKATKNAVEIEGSRQAHARDGGVMADLLAWLSDPKTTTGLSEIDVVTRLESLRSATNALVDLSFETICGSGPNGAITHYRVTTESNRQIRIGDTLLVDSGGQYRDGTTDITRTIAIGLPDDDVRHCFTLVLKGMIAISRARWPVGLAGRDLDGFARMALWQAGLDYDHGTGHGVGAFLGVHEGPQRLSRLSDVPLQPGMILSNEPGYYREGAFGIRIENLLVVQQAPPLPGGDDRPMLEFEILTFTPIERSLIDPSLLNADETAWLNDYHRQCLEKIGPKCNQSTQDWLVNACEPL